MGIKDFLFRMKVFGWYLITEPVRQFKDIYRLLVVILDKTINWMYIALTLVIISMALGKKVIGALLFAFMLLIFLVAEWESGMFMHRFRQRERKRLERKYRKEVEKNEKKHI